MNFKILVFISLAVAATVATDDLFLGELDRFLQTSGGTSNTATCTADTYMLNMDAALSGKENYHQPPHGQQCSKHAHHSDSQHKTLPGLTQHTLSQCTALIQPMQLLLLPVCWKRILLSQR